MKTRYFIISIVLFCSLKSFGQTDTTFKYAKPLFDFDYKKPVFKLQGEQLINQFGNLRFSAVTGCREGVRPITAEGNSNFNRYDDTVASTSRIRMYNLTIPEMMNHFPVNPNLMILEVKDPSKYVYDPKYGDRATWLRKNVYCYELTVPLLSLSGISQVDEFLEQAFKVKLSREKRKIKTLVLYRTSNVDKMKSAGKGERGYDNQGNFNNIPITERRFSSGMDWTFKMLPVVDETGYTDPVDMQLNISDWTDLPQIRKALQRYDLDLKEEMREVDEIIVIKEI